LLVGSDQGSSTSLNSGSSPRNSTRHGLSTSAGMLPSSRSWPRVWCLCWPRVWCCCHTPLNSSTKFIASPSLPPELPGLPSFNQCHFVSLQSDLYFRYSVLGVRVRVGVQIANALPPSSPLPPACKEVGVRNRRKLGVVSGGNR
jgi:hypothetical protein